MCWIELRFGSFTIYVYKYLRGCLASWKDAVSAGADRVRLFLHSAAGLARRPWPCPFPTQSRAYRGHCDPHLAQMRFRIIYV